MHIPLIRWRVFFRFDGIMLYTRISFLHIRYHYIPFLLFAVLVGLIPGLVVYNIGVTLSSSILITILVAAVGWFLTVTSARRLSRRQHTINVLQEHSFNQVSHQLVAKVIDRFPPGRCITKEEAETLVLASLNKTHSWHDTYNSLMYLLNYYEFIAVGIKNRDLDVLVMNNYCHGMVCKICEKAREYILCKQQKDPCLYENLVNLYRSWKPSDTFPAK